MVVKLVIIESVQRVWCTVIRELWRLESGHWSYRSLVA
jgi:hypothetical protein